MFTVMIRETRNPLATYLIISAISPNAVGGAESAGIVPSPR